MAQSEQNTYYKNVVRRPYLKQGTNTKEHITNCVSIIVFTYRWHISHWALTTCKIYTEFHSQRNFIFHTIFKIGHLSENICSQPASK